MKKTKSVFTPPHHKAGKSSKHTLTRSVNLGHKASGPQPSGGLSQRMMSKGGAWSGNKAHGTKQMRKLRTTA